jgi:hypothetical protein
MIDCG